MAAISWALRFPAVFGVWSAVHKGDLNKEAAATMNAGDTALRDDVYVMGVLQIPPTSVRLFISERMPKWLKIVFRGKIKHFDVFLLSTKTFAYLAISAPYSLLDTENLKDINQWLQRFSLKCWQSQFQAASPKCTPIVAQKVSMTASGPVWCWWAFNFGSDRAQGRCA